MASISTLVDRVKIYALSSGTGAFQLGSAVPAFRGVEALIDGATYSYALENGSTYEVGTGVYLLASGVLVRSPLLSSNGGAAVAFPANVEIVFTALAQDLTATGGSFPIANSLGGATDIAPSQKAATDGIQDALDQIADLAAQVTSLLAGGQPFTLPDEADGDPIPSAGTGLPYLSAGVLKIA